MVEKERTCTFGSSIFCCCGLDCYNNLSNEVFLTPKKWSASERRLLQVESKKHKPFRAFELSYSKWATYNIDKFEDITILEKQADGDYRISLTGESYLEEAQDTYYENWCGNLNVKKLFKNNFENNDELELFLEENEHGLEITNVQSDLRCTISSEDYSQLKKMFN
tara:strand:- start:66 stop:563 length:498 start_codon:yes stop_codon:yes gene_type:complete